MFHFLLKMKLKFFFVMAVFTLSLVSIKIFMGKVGSWLDPKPLRSENHGLVEVIKQDIQRASEGEEKLAFDLPILLWWTPFSTSQGVKTCHDSKKNYDCFFTQDRSLRDHPKTSAIFFYGTEFSPVDLPLPRKANEDWALIHEESPKNNPLISQPSIIKMFNHTSTFKAESDLPLTLQYLESIEDLLDSNYIVPLSEKNRLIQDEDLALVAYVQSSCDTPSGRDDYVSQLMKHIRVDSYGLCLQNRQLPDFLRDRQKMKDAEFLKILAKYKFVLAIENAVCEDYITEKLWKVLQVGSVPVYYGAPNVREWLPNEMSAILIEDFESPKELADHLQQLHQDDQAYMTYLRHKFPSSEIAPITNDFLVESLTLRKYGVSDQDQMSKGNFVQHFECLVCLRVGKNLEMSKIGFASKIPFQADENHYGCPSPDLQHEATLSNVANRWWQRQWQQATYEAKVLEDLILHETNVKVDKKDFYDQVLQRISEDTRKLLSKKS